MLNFGFSVYYSHSLKPKDNLGIMCDKQIQFMIVVPAFLKLLKAGIENEFHFKFGEEFNQVLNKLKKYNLELVDIETIKIEDDNIIDDVVRQLENFDYINLCKNRRGIF